MKLSDGARTGIFFGTTSGVITPCGLLVGLAAGTDSVATVVSGIFIVAIADSMSDAMGIHLAEESGANHSTRHVWTATAATLVSKLIVAVTFALPFFLASLNTAIAAALLWGALLLVVMSWQIARIQEKAPLPIIAEHLSVGIVVVLLSHFVGLWLGGVMT